MSASHTLHLAGGEAGGCGAPDPRVWAGLQALGVASGPLPGSAAPSVPRLSARCTLLTPRGNKEAGSLPSHLLWVMLKTFQNTCFDNESPSVRTTYLPWDPVLIPCPGWPITSWLEYLAEFTSWLSRWELRQRTVSSKYSLAYGGCPWSGLCL